MPVSYEGNVTSDKRLVKTKNLLSGGLSVGMLLCGSTPGLAQENIETQALSHQWMTSTDLISVDMAENTTLENTVNYSTDLPVADSAVDNRQVLAEEAFMLASQCDYDGSINIFKTLIKEYPEDLELQRNLAQVYSWQKDFSSAVSQYRMLLDQNPNAIDLRLGLAESLSWQGELSAAMREYRTVLAADPENIQASIGIAQVLDWQEDHDESIERYRDIVDSASNGEALPIEAEIGLANAIASKEDYAQAIALFENILVRFPESTNAKLGLADVYIELDRIQEALALLESTGPESCTHEVQHLFYKIRGVEIESDFSSERNSADESKYNLSSTARFRLNDGNTTQFVRVGQEHFQQNGFQDVSLTPVEIGMAGHAGFAEWEGTLGVDSSPRLSTPITAYGSVSWPVTPEIDIGLLAEWDSYKFKAETLENGIRQFRLNPSFHWEIDPNTTLFGNYQHSWLSDNNQENKTFLQAERSFADFFISADLFHWQFDRDTKNGYFAPNNLFYYGFWVGWDGRVTDSLDCRLALGMKFQTVDQAHTTATRYEASCDAEIDRYTDFSIKYSSNAELYQEDNLYPFSYQTLSAELLFRL
jgi:thioredoxin-like negative regulator of GroEL